MEKFTAEELLCRLEWRREIRNVMGRVSHAYSVKQEGSVYSRFFSKREDVCLGLNEGYYKGAAAVAGYYKALEEEIKLSSALIQKAFPDELGSLSEKEAFGVGMITYLPFESHVIEIADDGQTAKGVWNIRGSSQRLETCGPVAYWLIGYAAVDFIMEDGQWKIWHMLMLFNVNHQCGVGFCEEPKKFEDVEAFMPIGKFQLPKPNVAGPVFETFYPDRPKASPPRCPEAYKTFADTFSYGV